MYTEARDEAIKMLLSAQAHLGTKNVDHQMHDYVWRRRQDGINVLDVGKTWEKIQLAARIIVTIENPADVIAISGRPYAQRAVLKFASHTGAQSVAGRYTPGTFTNQLTKQVSTKKKFIKEDIEGKEKKFVHVCQFFFLFFLFLFVSHTYFVTWGCTKMKRVKAW
jgi:small subunit ribosomal protein SAe